MEQQSADIAKRPLQLIALSIEQDRFRLVAVNPNGTELLDSVPVRGRDHYPHDVVPGCMSHLTLRHAGPFLYLTHGGDGGEPTRIYSSADQGKTLVRVEPPPSTSLVREVNSGPDGTLVAVDDWRAQEASNAVWVRPPSGPWSRIALPKGFRAEAVSQTSHGKTYVAGGQLPNTGSDSDPSRHGRATTGWAHEALAVVGTDGIQILRPNLVAAVAAKIRGSWKYAEHLEGVDAVNEPLVILTRWRDFGGHCVLIADEPHWNHLDEQLLEPVVFRESRDVIAVYDGIKPRRFRTTDRGKTWEITDLGPAVRRALSNGLGDSGNERFVVPDVAARGSVIALIVRPLGSSSDAIIASSDGGKTYDAIAPLGSRKYQRLCLIE